MALKDESKIEGITWRLKPLIGNRAKLEKIWMKFGAPFNAIRFEVDVTQPPKTYVELFTMANEHGFYLIPILKGAVHFPGDEWPQYAKRAAAFVTELAEIIDAATYLKIAAFQIENELNHWLLHHREIPQLHKDQQQQLLVDTSLALRAVESDLDRGLTPLMINYSFDTIFYRSFNWKKSYEDYFKPYMATICSRGSIDIIAVDWYPGTLTPGSPQDIIELLTLIGNDFEQKTMIAETGYSTGKQTEEKQLNFYRTLREQLQTLGHEFLGVCWYELFDGYRSPGLGLNPFSFIEDHFGLIRSEDGAAGSTEGQPKRVYRELFQES